MGAYVKTGKPRGRKPDPNSKGPYVPTGKPRGKRADPNTVKFVYVPTGKPRGRKKGELYGKYGKSKGMKRGAAHHWHKAEEDKVPAKPYVPTGKPRGKPAKQAE